MIAETLSFLDDVFIFVSVKKRMLI